MRNFLSYLSLLYSNHIKNCIKECMTENKPRMFIPIYISHACSLRNSYQIVAMASISTYPCPYIVTLACTIPCILPFSPSTLFAHVTGSFTHTNHFNYTIIHTPCKLTVLHSIKGPNDFYPLLLSPLPLLSYHHTTQDISQT